MDRLVAAFNDAEQWILFKGKDLGRLATVNVMWRSVIVITPWYRRERRRVEAIRAWTGPPQNLDRQWWDNDTDSGS